MPNYEDSKIYKLCSLNSDDVYIGSTTQTLNKRLISHKKDYKRYLEGKTKSYYTSYKILEKGNYYIELIESYSCKTKKELHKREAEHIKNLNCINKNIPNRTRKEYCENNKQKIIEYIEKYYQENKEKIKEKQKKYNENNKQKIAEKAKEKITCECGSIIRRDIISRHKKTKKHIQFTTVN